MELNPELILEDARSIQEGLWRMARYAQDAAETLDARIEDEDLKRLDAPGVRGTLKQLARLGEIFVISDESVALSVVRLPGVPSADSDGWPAVVGRPARDRGVHFQLTGAMAVVVSKDSVARVFDDGRLVREISPGASPTRRSANGGTRDRRCGHRTRRQRRVHRSSPPLVKNVGRIGDQSLASDQVPWSMRCLLACATIRAQGKAKL